MKSGGEEKHEDGGETLKGNAKEMGTNMEIVPLYL